MGQNLGMMRLIEALWMTAPLQPYTEEDNDPTEPDSAPSRWIEEDEADDTQRHVLTPDAALALADAAAERGEWDVSKTYLEYVDKETR